MKKQRLPWLVTLLCGLTLIRWWVPLSPDKTATIAEPSTRTLQRLQSQPSSADSHSPTEAAWLGSQDLREPMASVGASPIGIADAKSDAFAIRPTKIAVATATPALAAPPASPVAVPLPSPVHSSPAHPETPVVQIIGTWDDVSAPGLFVQTPAGTRLVRSGDTLDGLYRVSAIEASQLVLSHASLGIQWRIQIPKGHSN
jgi:hypothetical protein